MKQRIVWGTPLQINEVVGANFFFDSKSFHFTRPDPEGRLFIVSTPNWVRLIEKLDDEKNNLVWLFCGSRELHRLVRGFQFLNMITKVSGSRKKVPRHRYWNCHVPRDDETPPSLLEPWSNRVRRGWGPRHYNGDDQVQVPCECASVVKRRLWGGCADL